MPTLGVMKLLLALLVAVSGCLDQQSEPEVDAAQDLWTEVNVSREIFGSGRDGDVVVPAAGVLTLTQDLYAHDLIFPKGVVSTIDPNEFAIYVSGTLRTSGLVNVFNKMKPGSLIRRNGAPAINDTVWGVGYPAGGTVGQGGSGTGGFSAAISTQTAGTFVGGSVWLSDRHPGAGGSGGGAGAVPPLAGISATVAAASLGSWSIDNAIRMRANDGTPIAGGAPGAGAAGFGGSGGAGGGNIVIVANEIESPEGMRLESEGGSGGDATAGNGGGGGGGGGGHIVIVTYRRQPLIQTSVIGGPGGVHLGTATDGGRGGDGVAIPFFIVL